MNDDEELEAFARIFRAETGRGLDEITDRTCPQCGHQGYPDSQINLRLYWCDPCGSAYFIGRD